MSNIHSYVRFRNAFSFPLLLHSPEFLWLACVGLGSAKFYGQISLSDRVRTAAKIGIFVCPPVGDKCGGPLRAEWCEPPAHHLGWTEEGRVVLTSCFRMSFALCRVLSLPLLTEIVVLLILAGEGISEREGEKNEAAAAAQALVYHLTIRQRDVKCVHALVLLLLLLAVHPSGKTVPGNGLHPTTHHPPPLDPVCVRPGPPGWCILPGGERAANN